MKFSQNRIIPFEDLPGQRHHPDPKTFQVKVHVHQKMFRQSSPSCLHAQAPRGVESVHQQVSNAVSGVLKCQRTQCRSVRLGYKYHSTFFNGLSKAKLCHTVLPHFHNPSTAIPPYIEQRYIPFLNPACPLGPGLGVRTGCTLRGAGLEPRSILDAFHLVRAPGGDSSWMG